ncbi:MAG: Hsp70 family protein [Methyloprofundus sp.]|uniref:Hsp70 family protein n=1 Tax=Methyloprofundus sp. TaxID=2020875 RepID=UPI00260FE9F4|nr:Hsp70 family protein [Methyloprofundus sp.]
MSDENKHNEHDSHESEHNPTDQQAINNKHYSIGIDLGTTHCVLSYADITDPDADEITQEVLQIPQLTAPGVIEDKAQLPSFLYQAHEAEINDGETALPWTAKPDYLVGEIARNLGTKTPIRLVSSAKSWLCHTGVDCKSAILPNEAPEEIERISPFQASSAYLEHLCSAWNKQHPEAPIQDQEITLTVPASFDPAARKLTAEAAQKAGLNNAILLEEPQAALYSWIEKSEGDWRNHANVGDIILVIDIGGGTTDLSLIAVTEEDGTLGLTRIAVGDHILLGGDNMDLALAYTLKAKLEQEGGKRLEGWQIQALTHACRAAKESILSNDEADNIPIVVPNRGSSLIGGTLRTELNRDEVNTVLLQGFLPEVTSNEQPVSRARTGLRTAGLPYAQDAAITRHLASFLTRQLNAIDEFNDISLPENASFIHPTAVLFNGGVLKAPRFADRLMNVINSWLSAEQAPDARLLTGLDLDLAVARGASYYGYVRKGKGVRIKGGTAASYYVGVESAMPAVPGMSPEIQALCIAPFGMEEATEVELPNDEFGVIVGEPVRFRFFGSKTRREDKVGTRLDYWSADELEELDEIEITLPEENRKAGEVIPVHLSVAVTEIGTLALQAISNQDDNRWKIEFDVRSGEE